MKIAFFDPLFGPLFAKMISGLRSKTAKRRRRRTEQLRSIRRTSPSCFFLVKLRPDYTTKVQVPTFSSQDPRPRWIGLAVSAKRAKAIARYRSQVEPGSRIPNPARHHATVHVPHSQLHLVLQHFIRIWISSVSSSSTRWPTGPLRAPRLTRTCIHRCKPTHSGAYRRAKRDTPCRRFPSSSLDRHRKVRTHTQTALRHQRIADINAILLDIQNTVLLLQRE